MKKYWIIENGRPIGPFTADELKVRRDFTAALPVWCSEFTDWTTVGNVPELACLVTEEAEDIELKNEEPIQEEIHEEAQPQPQPQQRIPWVLTPVPDEINGQKRPKNYMVWNIIMLLCCCLPAAVAGLIFSSQVNSKWMRGDVEGAIKASERAQWCIILSFVLGLVCWPFQALFL